MMIMYIMCMCVCVSFSIQLNPQDSQDADYLLGTSSNQLMLLLLFMINSIVALLDVQFAILLSR